MISPETQARLDRIREQQPDYTPNAEVREHLGQKSLVMVVGPCAVGKSYVIDSLVTNDARFGKVRSISTRDPRPDDTADTMQLFARDDEHLGQLANRIEAGEAVNYIVHPTTGDIYGTLDDSYPAEFNLLPTLSNSVRDFRKLPFASTHVVGLVTSPAAWKDWFEHRSFASAKDRDSRIAEAVLSIEWLLGDPTASIVTNMPGYPQVTADNIARLVDRGATERDEATAKSLLGYIKSMKGDHL